MSILDFITLLTMALFDNLNKKASLKALKMPPSLEAECNGILLKINLPFSVLNDYYPPNN